MAIRLSALALALALSTVAGAAAARDYIVVASSDPAITKGSSYDAGAKIALGAGQTLTLMHASGDMVRIRGSAGGVLLPRRQAGQAEAERLAVLRLIVSSTDKRPQGAMYATRTRGGVCPAPASITTLDGIVQVHKGGCPKEAAQALDAWLTDHPPADIEP
jgi:hypothetical protein